MPPAARVTDMHVCPKVEPGPVPHVGGPILPSGEPTVIIGFMPAARLGDPMQHGGVIVLGCPTVLIGSSAQGVALSSATRAGFCDTCEETEEGST